MSSHSLWRPVYLLRTGQHRVLFCSRFVANAPFPSRPSYLGEASVSGRRVLRDCLLAHTPSGEGGVDQSARCSYPANIPQKTFLCRRLRLLHTAQKYTRILYTLVCAQERRAQACVEVPCSSQFYVNPYAIGPPRIDERAVQQFVRGRHTQRANHGGIVGDKKAQGTSQSATASKSGGEKPPATNEKKLGSLPGQGKPTNRSADAQKVSRSASVQKTNADPHQKKRSLGSATGGTEKEEKPTHKIPLSPASQKTELGSVSAQEEPPGKSVNAKKVSRSSPTKEKQPANKNPRSPAPQKTELSSVSAQEKSSGRSVNAQKVLRSSSMQKGNAEPDKKKRSGKLTAEGEKSEGKQTPASPVSPESLFEFRYSRSSKPGGSSANKSETKVALHVPLKALEAYYGVPMEKLAEDPRGKVNKKGELIITSEKHASQALNKKECMQKLDDMLTSLHELYIAEEQKTPYVIDEETHKKYKFNILVRKKKEQYQRKCNQVSVRDL